MNLILKFFLNLGAITLITDLFDHFGTNESGQMVIGLIASLVVWNQIGLHNGSLNNEK